MSVHRTLTPLVLFAFAAAAALSCKDPSATAAPTLLAARSNFKTSTDPTPGGLVYCKQTYDSVSQVIGPKGGSIVVGNHQLWVDSLVLSDTVTITAVAPADTVRWVRFQPEGLQFPPSVVDLSYGMTAGAVLYSNFKDCGVLGQDLRIAQVNEQLGILDYLTSYSQSKRNWWSQGQQWVAALLPHFSGYAVAW